MKNDEKLLREFLTAALAGKDEDAQRILKEYRRNQRADRLGKFIAKVGILFLEAAILALAVSAVRSAEFGVINLAVVLLALAAVGEHIGRGVKVGWKDVR